MCFLSLLLNKQLSSQLRYCCLLSLWLVIDLKNNNARVQCVCLRCVCWTRIRVDLLLFAYILLATANQSRGIFDLFHWETTLTDQLINVLYPVWKNNGIVLLRVNQMAPHLNQGGSNSLPKWYKCNNDLSQTENRNIAVNKWEASVFISRICGLKSVLKTKSSSS